ncbi:MULTISPECIES: flippase [Bacteroides]|uniref:flippase n=1 Tax=Bacteroides TaxID=816 RepID=UPI00214B532D|nr:flippase [Bacteroides acidifaciens]MCR1997026.1 flippase [Bacteroides acidifaciens]
MGLKKNILYSSFLTTSNYLFQFLTYPYVARVLGVTGIGVCNFAQSLIQYFMLFSTLGVMTLGTREIAKCNGDRGRQNIVFSSLFELTAIATFIIVLIYLCLIETVPKLAEYRSLLYIGVFQLIFNTLTIEWLFRGLEDFKYITIRTFWTKVFYVVAVFIFIQDQQDYLLYFVITVSVYIVNGVINLSYSYKWISFSWQPLRSILHFIKPMLVLGIYAILTNMYLSFNIMYLGFVSNDDQVGYYTTATKIQNIILALYTSFTLVMMPRISSMLAKKDMDGIKNAIAKSLNLLYAFAFPIIVLSVVFAYQIVYIIAGSGYEQTVPVLQIAMPLILVVGIEQILIIQLLMPLGEDKAVFINALVGATVAIILNILLVKELQSIGSIIVWFSAEVSVLISANIFVRKKIGNIISVKKLVIYIIMYLPLLLLCYMIKALPISEYFSLIISLVFTVLYCHFCLLYVVRNDIYKSLFIQLKSKLSIR